MNDDSMILKPWYDSSGSYNYGKRNETIIEEERRSRTVSQPVQSQKIEDPLLKLINSRTIVDKKHPRVAFSPDSVETMAMVELTAAARMALRGSRDFSMRSYTSSICTSWFQEASKKGLKDVCLLCDFESKTPASVMCSYSDGHLSRLSLLYASKQDKLIVEERPRTYKTFERPECNDNASDFMEALLDISYVAVMGWKDYFLKAAKVLGSKDCSYDKQPGTFYLPQPYFKYLLAVSLSKTGGGMGSWYDTPNMGSNSFVIATNELHYQRWKALLYVANNC